VFGKKKVAVLEELVKDPICGMHVDPNNAYYTEIGGKIYHFCGAGCKAAFKKAQKEDQYNARPIKVRRSSRGGGGCCH
jgi:YHS domain-containing protein